MSEPLPKLTAAETEAMSDGQLYMKALDEITRLRAENQRLQITADQRETLIVCCEEGIVKLLAARQRLLEYAHLVETATEAEDANGRTDGDATIITLHCSWFYKARELLAAGDSEVRDE